jgi:hypothetical protein
MAQKSVARLHLTQCGRPRSPRLEHPVTTFPVPGRATLAEQMEF